MLVRLRALVRERSGDVRTGEVRSNRKMNDDAGGVSAGKVSGTNPRTAEEGEEPLLLRGQDPEGGVYVGASVPKRTATLADWKAASRSLRGPRRCWSRGGGGRHRRFEPRSNRRAISVLSSMR